MRITCTGVLYMCLGHSDKADLLGPLRKSEGNEAVKAAIREAISRKPEKHNFVEAAANEQAAVSRHMNVTGG